MLTSSNAAYIASLAGSTACFVCSSVLLKTWRESQSLIVILSACAAIGMANILYANLLTQGFSRGYLLSAISCLLGTLSVGHFLYHEQISASRIAAAVCFLLGVSFLAFSNPTKG